jgi:hypothetical protein
VVLKRGSCLHTCLKYSTLNVINLKFGCLHPVACTSVALDGNPEPEPDLNVMSAKPGACGMWDSNIVERVDKTPNGMSGFKRCLNFQFKILWFLS